MNFKLKIWKQKNLKDKGVFREYGVKDISPNASFLEMLDVVNEELILKREDPIAFDHDCREGICGACSLVIDGRPHGHERAVTTCQLHMRYFKNEATIVIEPFRAKTFPIVKDLVTDRSAFDRIIQSAGYVSVSTGGAPDANCIPIPKLDSDKAMDAAQCIGCGACVAACKNASAMLFVSAKVSHLALLPQGRVERTERVLKMVESMDKEGFGNCTNEGECEAECPKGIKLENIGRLNREFFLANLSH